MTILIQTDLYLEIVDDVPSSHLMWAEEEEYEYGQQNHQSHQQQGYYFEEPTGNTSNCPIASSYDDDDSFSLSSLESDSSSSSSSVDWDDKEFDHDQLIIENLARLHVSARSREVVSSFRELQQRLEDAGDSDSIVLTRGRGIATWFSEGEEDNAGNSQTVEDKITPVSLSVEDNDLWGSQDDDVDTYYIALKE